MPVRISHVPRIRGCKKRGNISKILTFLKLYKLARFHFPHNELLFTTRASEALKPQQLPWIKITQPTAEAILFGTKQIKPHYLSAAHDNSGLGSDGPTQAQREGGKVGDGSSHKRREGTGRDTVTVATPNVPHPWGGRGETRNEANKHKTNERQVQSPFRNT